MVGWGGDARRGRGWRCCGRTGQRDEIEQNDVRGQFHAGARSDWIEDTGLVALRGSVLPVPGSPETRRPRHCR